MNALKIELKLTNCFFSSTSVYCAWLYLVPYSEMFHITCIICIYNLCIYLWHLCVLYNIRYKEKLIQYFYLSYFIIGMYVYVLSLIWLFATPWTVAHQAPLSMEFSGQEYWSRLSFPSPGSLFRPTLSTELTGGFFTTWESLLILYSSKQIV